MVSKDTRADTFQGADRPPTRPPGHVRRCRQRDHRMRRGGLPLANRHIEPTLWQPAGGSVGIQVSQNKNGNDRICRGLRGSSPDGGEGGRLYERGWPREALGRMAGDRVVCRRRGPDRPRRRHWRRGTTEPGGGHTLAASKAAAASLAPGSASVPGDGVSHHEIGLIPSSLRIFSVEFSSILQVTSISGPRGECLA